jgi:transposase
MSRYDLTDFEWRVIEPRLTAGQAHDGQIADALLDYLVPRNHRAGG